MLLLDCNFLTWYIFVHTHISSRLYCVHENDAVVDSPIFCLLLCHKNFFHSKVRDSLKISCVLIIVITVVSLYALMHDVFFSLARSFLLLLYCSFFSVSNVVINLIPSKFELYFDLTSPDKPFKHIVRSHAINNIEQTLSQILLKRQRRRQRRFLSFC